VSDERPPRALGGAPARERPAVPPGPYLVVGLRVAGAAAARMLRAHGEVMGCDRGAPAEATGLEGVEVELESEGVDLVERARTVVKSPGVPASAPAIAAARARGLEVIGELELAWRLLANEFVAVTGTNGKTTTSELLGAIYREAGEPVVVAGNAGTPLAALVTENVDPAAVVVCESSSFQLEDSSAFAPECALLLNVAEDHLDRHGSFEAYRAAKLRVFANQRPDDVAVTPLGLDLPGAARAVTFGAAAATLAHRDDDLWWRGERLMPAADVRLRGAHNLENAMAAAAAALARGVREPGVTGALATFAGVRHRLEEVAERDGVTFVNDSKATNVASASVGVEAYAGGVHLILGGSPKGGGFAGLREPVAERCRACYLIGAAAEAIAADLAGAVPVERCGDLERATTAAARAARPGDVVLLSPACASFDQYPNFEARGDHFRALAIRLARA